ncbi:uncharacterized protein LOC131049130 [Cryptomeria japonica]|uniref:uncharacterized protein LOC131049130 n=1 Tax=Cryptomeria japonica TaxID=3369 RepID=UPI0025AC27C7|nr:uncharacterized protein LOC131049130 [Cryptomeria japonica]
MSATHLFPCFFPSLHSSNHHLQEFKQSKFMNHSKGFNGISLQFSKKITKTQAQRESKELSKSNGFTFSVPSLKKLFLQAAVGVFALGFIDAGYSGDWSRIGVISKDVEAVLKVAAYFVVPLSVGLILFLSREKK